MRDSTANIFPSLQIVKDIPNLSLLDETEDFSEFLTSLGVEYRGSQYYWQAGSIQKTQGWILHLSVIKTQLTQLINLVIPFLINENISFKIARSRTIAGKLLNGGCGSKHLAKVIRIYPPTDEQAAELASKLIRLTADFKGPAIPTDFCLGNIVYTRYGSFSPVWVKDQKGKPVKHIYNEKEELIPDPYYIPFTFPPGLHWPFSQLADPVLPKRSKLLNARYYPISTIKRDYRGDVLKAIYFKRLWNIKACVLKQARKYMGSDADGRSISDRLQWQYALCKQLAGSIPLPKVFDYFTENGDNFLAMEFVKGKSMVNWLTDLYKNRVWFDLPFNLQQQIFNVLSQVIDIVHRLHEKGLVHRDITPGNFLITKKNKAIPIDLELTWSLHSGMSSPPFLLGTPGYMSPQQADRAIPTIADDIYAVGALVLECCTNLNPTKISTTSWAELRSHMFFFTHDEKISNLIADCLQEDPSKRPALDKLRNILSSCLDSSGVKTTIPSMEMHQLLDQTNLKWTIQAGLNGLANPEILSTKGIWVSVKLDEKNVADLDQQEVEQYEGWHTGMAGPLWLVALAGSAGFDIEPCREAYMQSWNYIFNHYFKDPASVSPSLYYGSAGIAMALTEGLNSGLLMPDSETLTRIQICFSASTTELTLSKGIAGQGIAALHASAWLDKPYVRRLLDSYVEDLAHSQQSDGSWNLEVLGLDNGISGIIWFLLAYFEHSSNHSVEPIIRRALNWLITNKNNKHMWGRMQSSEGYNIWCNGQSAVDISMLMIRSFEVLGEKQYKQLAEKNLQTIPDHLVDANFTLDSGLARVGELYLEAYRVFNDPLWLAKATWLTNLLLHSFIPRNDTEGYWFVNSDINVTADLYRGNSGTIHYLMRYLQGKKIGYPL